MFRRIHLLSILLTCGAAIAPVSRATAQSAGAAATPAVSSTQAQSGRPARESTLAERQRLRVELARAQAEIDRLKQGERGLRTDYILRARLADAEALARRLTEIDGALGVRPDVASARAAAGAPQRIGDEPIVSPGDGPAELEAKADILADQAHRVEAQAAALKVRVDQARGRRELRRRAHQLDSDPFAPLEGSRRRLLTSGPSPSPAPLKAGDAPTPHGGVSITNSATSAPRGATDSPVATTPATPGPVPPPVQPQAQVRVHDVLDPGALAQGRKADQNVAVATDVESMERALAALTARAQHLDSRAKVLRAQARTR